MKPLCKHRLPRDECFLCFNEKQMPIDSYLAAELIKRLDKSVFGTLSAGDINDAIKSAKFLPYNWQSHTVKHLRESPNAFLQLSEAQVEQVAGATIILADAFELSYQEMAENLARFMTEREFKQVIEEIEDQNNG